MEFEKELEKTLKMLQDIRLNDEINRTLNALQKMKEKEEIEKDDSVTMHH